MTDSPVPAMFLPLTDLELAQITADLAPMGFRWTRMPRTNLWITDNYRAVVVNEGASPFALDPTRRFSAGGGPVTEWVGFDSHISAATWLLMQG